MTTDFYDLDKKVQHTESTIMALLNGPNNVVSSTKFGTDSIVFLHLINNIAPAMPVIWVDTGYNTRQSLSFIDEVTSHLDLNLHTFKPNKHEFETPPDIDNPSHADFTEEVKLAPFREALKSLSATHWVSSVRAYQTNARGNLQTTEKLSEELTKVHPMLNWSKQDMANYRKKHALPEGPPSYDPTKGEIKRECGLHTVQGYF